MWMKKTLAVFLVLCLLLALAPAGVLAADEEEASPVPVETAEPENPADRPDEAQEEEPAEEPEENTAEAPAEDPEETPAEEPKETPEEEPAEEPEEEPEECNAPLQSLRPSNFLRALCL